MSIDKFHVEYIDYRIVAEYAQLCWYDHLWHTNIAKVSHALRRRRDEREAGRQYP
jgi:hypothetical protein